MPCRLLLNRELAPEDPVSGSLKFVVGVPNYSAWYGGFLPEGPSHSQFL